MNVYELVFYWVGVASSVVFVLLGFSVFGAWVMNITWRHFKHGKVLADVIMTWREHGKNTDELDKLAH